MSNTIRFVLDGQVREVAVTNPAETVLEWLRGSAGRCGTKEGCAEGDCGACTVTLGELDGTRIRYRAVNACILFLPVLDGKQLVTVESLAEPDGTLHPVQRAMVEHHGSQCGFCTPGFVMSMFALAHRGESGGLDRGRINDALAGNLCRCTGYRPIVDAAADACAAPAPDRFDRDEAATVALLETIRPTGTLAAGGFFAPTTIEALATLRLAHPESVLLAGGTDVGLWVTKQHRDLGTVIYTGNVAELRQISIHNRHSREGGNPSSGQDRSGPARLDPAPGMDPRVREDDGESAVGEIEIGAAVTYAEAHALLGCHYPDLGELIRRLGSTQIRNSGTIGGNIGNGSPIGDGLPALIALDAVLVLRRGADERELPLADFFIKYRQTALLPGEFIARIRVPLPRPGLQYRAYKISKRFDQDISAVCACFALVLDEGKVAYIRLAFGGMAGIPLRARTTEAALIGKPWNEAAVEVALPSLDADMTPLGDMRASAEYRRLVARNLLRKFALETGGETLGETVRVLELEAAE